MKLLQHYIEKQNKHTQKNSGSGGSKQVPSYKDHFTIPLPGPTALDASTLSLSYRGGGPLLGIEPGPPALEASTLSLSYRGGGPLLGIEPGPPALYASTLSLGYRGGGPLLGIEAGTYRTRCQHSTTRLSRRRSFTGD